MNMKKKKNAFWTFILSFIPGCAEMYWGLMKQGLSLLTLFMGIGFLATLTGIGALMFAEPVVWFYSFFHARNMAHLEQEELNRIEDQYLTVFSANSLNKVLSNKVAAWILIVLGGIMLLQTFIAALERYLPDSIGYLMDDVVELLPQGLFSALIIWGGISMIGGKKRELLEKDKAEMSANMETDMEADEDTEAEVRAGAAMTCGAEERGDAAEKCGAADMEEERGSAEERI